MELSLRGYAKKRGVTLRAVQKAIASGRIQKTAAGKIDPDEADRDWAGTTRPTAPSVIAPPIETKGEQLVLVEASSKPRRVTSDEEENVRGEYQFSRARREKAEADLAQLKFARENRELLPFDEVSRTLAQIGRIYGTAREAVPTQIATKLVGKSDVDEIERILRAEFTAVDKRICDEIAARFPDLARAPVTADDANELHS